MRKVLENQYQNLFLWVGLVMSLGAALYFTLPYEPNIPYSFVLAGALFAIMIWKRVPIFLRGLAIFMFGFMYACAYTNIIDTPQIKSTMRDTNIVGNVYKIDFANEKSRVYIKTNDDMRVRVSVGENIPTPNVGDEISATATLFRPAGAYAPATFDYARWAYFNGLSATGYISDYQTINSANGFSINSLRDDLHNRSNSFLVDSLVLGYKNAVPESDNKIWTATGIGHVWSISGFHMTLVGGWLFAIFFVIFRSIPYITRRTPARIPAIICAWVGLLGYLFISGLDVATIRAFLMTTLVFMAFIFGRNAISMRNICLAFCLIFLINPHYVMQPGFQLSFSAVFGLIWFWGDTNYKKRTRTQKALRTIYATAMTSVIATIFTAPFVIAHFYAIPIYGLIGNLILLPIFSFAIMPLVLIGAGGATWATNIAHNIYDWALNIAMWISDLPAATIIMQHISNAAMVLFILGLACVIFIRATRWRENLVIGGTFICIGIVSVITQPRPIFMSTFDNELVAFLRDDGNLAFNKKSASKHYFAFDTFLQISGAQSDSARHKHKCSRGACEFKKDDFKLMYTQRFKPLAQNLESWCTDDDVDYIVSYLKIDAPKCNHKILRGGFIIYDNGRIEKVRLNRHWHNQRE